MKIDNISVELVWLFKFNFLNVGSISDQPFADLGRRDKTRVHMLAKIFPHLKLKCSLYVGPTLGFDIKQKKSFFLSNLVFFYNKNKISDNIIHC
jgi:hypothetical protein